MSQPSAAEVSMEVVQHWVDHHGAHMKYHADALAYWENKLAKRKAMQPLNDEVVFSFSDPCRSMLMMECRDLRMQRIFIWRKRKIMPNATLMLLDRTKPLQAL